MGPEIDPRYPSIDDLIARAKKRIPRFAFEYLDGGCNEDVNLRRNTSDIREVELRPQYLREHRASNMSTELFGHVYDAPFGVSPIGLQGLVWPRSPEILAKAAFDQNLPFILSTVSTSSIETIAEITEGQAWFQLYHPTEDRLRDDVIRRAEAAGCPVLVILCDVPTFGYRPRDIRNGLALPPKMTPRNLLQMLGRPSWALHSLAAGRPEFETMKSYTPKGLNLKELGAFMDETFSGRLNALPTDQNSSQPPPKWATIQNRAIKPPTTKSPNCITSVQITVRIPPIRVQPMAKRPMIRIHHSKLSPVTTIKGRAATNTRTL